MACKRFVGAVNPEPVDGTRIDLGNVTVPDLIRVLRQHDAFNFLGAHRVEQANLNLGGIGRKQREVAAFSIPYGSVRRRSSLAHPVFVYSCHATLTSTMIAYAADGIARRCARASRKSGADIRSKSGNGEVPC